MLKTLLSYFDIKREEEDYLKIHESIAQGIIFRGTNLWILIFAIVVCSVGLNMNSTAVVIGAMLISPLMGPINGVGYSIATYNFPLFRSSMKNFGFAVVVSLVASAAYFALSPISSVHSELLSRTSPTIYDVIIALFGGFAGIVAISSKLKGNVIPGVAIATALMPPLCTAGYGLATGQFYFFFGAMYLFTINTVFIALSAFIVSQILRFPFATIVDETRKKNVNRLLSLVIVLTVGPSVYFGYQLVGKEKFRENASRYTNNIAFIGGNYLLKNKVDPNKKTITLIYGGSTLNEADKTVIRAKARDFSLEKAEIIIQQGFSLAEEDLNVKEIDKYKGEINRLNKELKDRILEKDSTETKLHLGGDLLSESKAIIPYISSCTYAESYIYSDTSYIPIKMPVIILTTRGKSISRNDKTKMEQWLKARLKREELKTYFEEEN